MQCSEHITRIFNYNRINDLASRLSALPADSQGVIAFP
jgi:hypothetical protein